MMKINEFMNLYGLTRRDLAGCIDIPRRNGESDIKYRDRVYQRIRRRETSGWEMMYCDGVVTMTAPDGGEHRHNARRLDDFIAPR